MNKRICAFVFIFLFAAQAQLLAQKGVHKKIISLKPPVVVNFKQLADYERAHPIAKKRRAIEQGEDREEKYKFKKKHLPLGAKKFTVNVPSSNPASRTVATNSPSPSIVFNGIIDDGTIIPPDIEGAAGTVYLLEVTNQEFDLFNKNGALNSIVSPPTLFASTSGSGYFDPHVVYDQNYGRYLICMGGYLSDGNSGVFLAVSETGDPTGNWYIYAFDGTGDPDDLLDFPLLGYNKNWVVITGNDFTADANPVGKVFVFNRAATYSGSSGTVTSFSDSNSFSMSPAQTIDPAEATEYLVEDYDGNNGGGGYMQIPTITGSANAPVYSTGNIIGVSNTWDENPISVPQLGSVYTLEVGDTRVGGSSVYSNGTLWFSHTVFLPAGSPTHDGVDWWQVDPAAVTIKQYGRIEDLSGVMFYFYPSISVNRIGDALLGYCESSSYMYASSSYSFHAKTDVADVMENTYLFQPGLESYFKDFGSGRNRWGDFTGAALDPTDSSFWDFNEWANKNNNWATVITNVLATGSTECIIPSGLITANITDSSVSLSWNAVPGDSKYYIEYRAVTASTWIIDSTTATSYSITGLNSTTQYEWQIQSRCSANTTSLYTPSTTFQTLTPCNVSAPVTSSSVTICSDNSTVLTATGTDTIFWFASDTATTPLAKGNHFTTPLLLSNTTYYTKSSVSAALQHAGPVDSTFGTASIFTNDNYHDLVFDCYTAVRLVSVKVYAQGAGDRTITLEDEIGDTLGYATVNIPDGTSRVALNFNIPIENNLELGIEGTVNLLRNDAGASFPYVISNVLSINGTNADGLPGYYYYFYDWEVQRPPCNSPLSEVNVNVIDPVAAFASAIYGDSVAFTNNSTTSTSWLWTFGDGDSSTQQIPSHRYSDSGTYNVILHACTEGCCNTLSHEVVIIATGISSASANNTIRVYPNPVTGNLLITFGSAVQMSSSILKFTNSIGQVVFEKALTVDEMSEDYVLNTSRFAEGIYTLIIENEQGRFVQKIIKE